MRRLMGWIIGGLVTMALWVPGAGAQDGRQLYQGMRHDWRDIRQDRQDVRRDWRDIQRDHTRLWPVIGRPSGVIAFNYAWTAGNSGTIGAMRIATTTIAGRLPWGSC